MGVLQTIHQKHGVKITKVYEELMGLSFSKRLTLPKFKKAIFKIKDSIPLDLVVTLFK